MVLKVYVCPHCQNQIRFKIDTNDIDHTFRYPAPIYIKHANGKCNKTSTCYLDSELRISLFIKEKENTSKWAFCKEIKSTS